MLDAVRMIGTSPREWGKRYPRFASIDKTRNIPTRVGKTHTEVQRRGENSEHPHASGENTPVWSMHARTHGTSPREWGKLQKLGNSPVPFRNIPTRVGKTSRAS